MTATLDTAELFVTGDPVSGYGWQIRGSEYEIGSRDGEECESESMARMQARNVWKRIGARAPLINGELPMDDVLSIPEEPQ